MLRQFGGYTYTTLMDEDPELVRLLQIEGRGTKEEAEAGDG